MYTSDLTIVNILYNRNVPDLVLHNNILINNPNVFIGLFQTSNLNHFVSFVALNALNFPHSPMLLKNAISAKLIHKLNVNLTNLFVKLKFEKQLIAE